MALSEGLGGVLVEPLDKNEALGGEPIVTEGWRGRSAGEVGGRATASICGEVLDELDDEVWSTCAHLGLELPLARLERLELGEDLLKDGVAGSACAHCGRWEGEGEMARWIQVHSARSLQSGSERNKPEDGHNGKQFRLRQVLITAAVYKSIDCLLQQVIARGARWRCD